MLEIAAQNFSIELNKGKSPFKVVKTNFKAIDIGFGDDLVKLNIPESWGEFDPIKPPRVIKEEIKVKKEKLKVKDKK